MSRKGNNENSSSPNAAEIADFICAVLRGEPAQWPWPHSREVITCFLGLAEYHGVVPLLNEALRNRESRRTWPSSILEECRKAAAGHAMLDLARQVELCRVLDRFGTAGIKPLLLKGTPLAYSHYSASSLRPRGDTDLLIPLQMRSQADEVLRRLGYVPDHDDTFEAIFTQKTWSHVDRLGLSHHLDVHWQVSNSPMLARLLDYRELDEQAEPLPQLGQNAYAPGPVHALLFACMHWAGHKYVPYWVDDVPHIGGDRLIWFYDMHLLASSISESDFREFVRLAKSKGLMRICLEALERTQRHFRTSIPKAAFEELGCPGSHERVADYLSKGPFFQMLGDFLAIDNGRERLAWLRELALPSPGHMNRKYPDAKVRWLPVLYARRAFGGLARLARSQTFLGRLRLR